MTTATRTSERAPVTLINPPGLYDPLPNGYSHIATTEGGRTVYLSGQGGETEDGNLSPDFHTQVRQAFSNLRIALDAAGAEIRNVAKLTVLVVDHDMERLEIFGEELTRAFGPDWKPACTLIPVSRLALDEMQVEIEAVAVIADGQSA